MAREFGVSKATVQRVWSQNEIKPHLTRVFKLSSDPDFEAKFWDVIGLYLNPPEQAVVLCCDEEVPDPGAAAQSTGSASGQRTYPHSNPRLLSQRHRHSLCRAGLLGGQSHRSHCPETHPSPVAGISQANQPRNSFEPAHPRHSG